MRTREAERMEFLVLKQETARGLDTWALGKVKLPTLLHLQVGGGRGWVPQLLNPERKSFFLLKDLEDFFF